jgi:phosphoenolpyruvate carboxykinase (ATP)
MPPIARLSVEQAMYHFISGYTSKIAGTEIGLREEPEITFSACFGGPFMVHRPAFYADLLRRKIERYGVKCWLVNTGWVGGPYGVGRRISIRHTRNLLTAALSGALDTVEYNTDPFFSFQVPKSCPEVPEEILYPAQSWHKEEEYWKKYRQLASRFIDNMKKFEADTPREVVEAGPRI